MVPMFTIRMDGPHVHNRDGIGPHVFIHVEVAMQGRTEE